jgi:hypothetical protein
MRFGQEEASRNRLCELIFCGGFRHTAMARSEYLFAHGLILLGFESEKCLW